MIQRWTRMKWYERPLLCLFKLHPWRVHPGDHTIRWCPRCLEEMEAGR